MAKSLAIPQQVVECLNYFAPADRGQAFTAIFEYISTGKEPGNDISAAARGAFEFARRIIDPIIERRRKAAERRAARKAALQESQSPEIQTVEAETSRNVGSPSHPQATVRPVVSNAPSASRGATSHPPVPVRASA